MSAKLVDINDPVGSHDVGRNAMGDFRDVVYFPTKAVAANVNPYDSRLAPLPDGSPRYRQRYSVLNLFPLYSPLVLILFGGFALPDFHTAACFFFVANVGLLVGYAWMLCRVGGREPSLEIVLWLAALMLVTQAGRACMLGGETSIALAIGTVAAASWSRQNSTVAGLALALTSFKPTFGLPLGCLLLMKRTWGTVALGWGLGFVIGVVGLLLIFGRAGDLDEFIPILRHNQGVADADPDVDPLRSATRIDSAGAIARLTGIDHPLLGLGSFLGVMTIAGGAIWKWSGSKTEEAERLAQVVVIVATTAAIYHLIYDGLVLWGALAILVFGPPKLWKSTSPRLRYLICCLLLSIQFNILPSDVFQNFLVTAGISSERFPAWLTSRMWSLVCSLNGLCLLTVLLILAWLAWKWPADDSPTTAAL